MTEALIALVALTAMEIVLGIDNIVFIAILTGRLPEAQRASAQRIGLGIALGARILLLLTLRWILGLNEPIFYIHSLGIPAEWLNPESDGISVRDLILLVGGMFLVAKSVHEIHHKFEQHDPGRAPPQHVTFRSVLVQIALLDIVFSLDSVITAVGMVNTNENPYGLYVMIVAIVLAVLVMLAFAGRISGFVERHPTLKILALSFLILIGVMLIAEGIGQHINKGYIYFAMAFSLVVEAINIRVSRPRHGH